MANTNMIEEIKIVICDDMYIIFLCIFRNYSHRYVRIQQHLRINNM